MIFMRDGMLIAFVATACFVVLLAVAWAVVWLSKLR